jgi:hypothetical protein
LHHWQAFKEAFSLTIAWSPSQIVGRITVPYRQKSSLGRPHWSKHTIFLQWTWGKLANIC